jgi:D-methionine transport system substrate-binding protein
MNTKIKFLATLALLSSSALLFSCGGGTKKDDPNHIKVGVESGPEYDLAEAAKKVAKKNTDWRWNSFSLTIM